jgi:hypothetical protein
MMNYAATDFAPGRFAAKQAEPESKKQPAQSMATAGLK